MGAVAGLQLAHAGRKGSVSASWKGGNPLALSEGGWSVVGPSPLPFSEHHALPEALDEQGIEAVKKAFFAGAQRALQAGFKVLEIHSAHVYLLHAFLSPLSNQRQDRYGGSFENRIRLLTEIATDLR